MTRQERPGWFGEIMPESGAWAVSGPDGIVTSGGPPPNPGEALMFLRLAYFNRNVYLIGKGHESGTAWMWSGGAWLDCGLTHGNSPCAWDHEWFRAVVCRSDGRAESVLTDGGGIGMFDLACGSQGIRWIRDDSSIVTGDASYGDGRGMSEFTDFGDVSIGQCDSGVGVRFAADGIVRVVEGGGDTLFVRVNRHGDQFGIAFRHVESSVVVLLLMTATELLACPPETIAPTPPQPEPNPEEPMIWTDAHTQLLTRFAAKMPPPPTKEGQSQESWDASWRMWTGQVARQFCHSCGPAWGHKRADPNRPLSADCIAYKSQAGFAGFDLRNGATGQLVTQPGAIDLTGQTFVPVEPVDYLGDTVPVEPPIVPPTPDPTIPPVPPAPTETRLDSAITAFCRDWLGL